MVASLACALAVLAHCLAAASAALPYTGFLIDNFCWNRKFEGNDHISFDERDLSIEPQKHILHCLYKIVCIPDGYAFLVEKTPTPTPTYDIKFQLDDAGDALALQLILDEVIRAGDRQFMEQVTAHGTLSGTTIMTTKLCHTPAGHTEVCHGPALPYTGYLVDNFCWKMANHTAIDSAKLGTSPETHSLKCMFLPQCIPDGYMLLGEQPLVDTGDDGFKYRIKFQLDKAGDDLAKVLVETEHTRGGNRAFSEKVTVTGTLTGNTVNVATMCHTPPSHTKICHDTSSVVSGSFERRVCIGAMVALIYSISAGC